MENSAASVKLPKERKWVVNIIAILYFGGLALSSYVHITQMEKKGYVVLRKFLSLPYDLAGKWGLVGFWGLFILYNVISGILTAIKENR